MRDIALHVFTNATANAPATGLIETTVRSWQACFGSPARTCVWCDPHPNRDKADVYLSRLRDQFDCVYITQSLSDGYVRAVKESHEPYLFMLEHDWVFLPTVVHSLDHVVSVMRDHGLLHMRFNKRQNQVWKSDKVMQQIDHPLMSYCITNFISNNPHVIDRARWLQQALPFVKIRDKSFGIEKELSATPLQGTIYGPLGQSAAVRHLDGKNYQELP